jgi:hypothetical protein
MENISIVAPNIGYNKNEKLFILFDPHMKSDARRYITTEHMSSISRNENINKRKNYDFAVYLGSAVDFIFYESIIYTLSKIRFLVVELLEEYDEIIFFLNSNMVKNSKDFFETILIKIYPKCKICYVGNEEICVEKLLILSINPAQVKNEISNIREFALLIRKKYMFRSGSFTNPILLTRGKNIYYNLEWRKPVNFKKFECYAFKKGWLIVDPSLYSIEKVVNMLEESPNIISYHSGSLVHLIFCFKVRNVSELYSEWYDECLLNICIASNFNYKSHFFPMILRFDLLGVIFRIIKTRKLTFKERVWKIDEENFEKILNSN